MKTVDEAGQPVDDVTLQMVEDSMRAVASDWGGSQFGLAGVERGTSTREGQSGWLTVKWVNLDGVAFCGASPVGLDGGVIQFNYLRATCSCAGSRISPRTARHELGHAFGYWHTDGNADVMSSSGSFGGCTAVPSAREVYHARIAYQTPIGTMNAMPIFFGLRRTSGLIVD
jgi:hypothetical protein